MNRLKLGIAGLALGASTLLADLNVMVTNLPQKVFVEKIGGEHVHVHSMVPPGSNPHNYKPKTSQMMELSKADLYFTVGIEFEEAWLPKLSAQNKKMKIAKMHEGVNMIEFDEYHEEHHGHKEEHHHHHEGIDPHSWMSPVAVKIMAKNILHELKHLDSGNANYYEKNYQTFLKEIKHTDHEIKHALEDVARGTEFMVFHPGFGYFAHQYNLIQVAIEVEGKEPKPKMLAKLIKEAQHERIKTVITSPEFSDKAAKVIAKEIGGSVVKISPISPNWSENLINLAKTIAADNAKRDHDTHHHHEGHAH